MNRIEIGFKCGLVKDKFDKFKMIRSTGKIALTKGRFAQCLYLLLRIMKDTPQELLTFKDVLNATYAIRCFSTRCLEELQVWTQFSFFPTFPGFRLFENNSMV